MILKAICSAILIMSNVEPYLEETYLNKGSDFSDLEVVQYTLDAAKSKEVYGKSRLVVIKASTTEDVDVVYFDDGQSVSIRKYLRFKNDTSDVMYYYSAVVVYPSRALGGGTEVVFVNVDTEDYVIERSATLIFQEASIPF